MKLSRVSTLPMAFLWVLGLAVSQSGCYDFNTVGPEDPPALKLPATVSVSVVYTRPSACVNTTSPCAGPVNFLASWLPLGSFVTLQQSGAHTWVATLTDVPINYPGGEPHRVYAVDTYLLDTETAGISADRLVIGGEPVWKIEHAGGRNEQALIYIDANGKSRKPL